MGRKRIEELNMHTFDVRLTATTLKRFGAVMPACRTSTDCHTLASRLQVIEDLGLSREAEFDELVQLAAMICQTPISRITLLDGHTQWFKASYGSQTLSTGMNESVCFVAAQQTDLLVIEDLTQDHRFNAFPSVVGDQHLRFYAGYPLRAASGDTVGTLCVLDTEARQLHSSQYIALEILAKQVQTRLELTLQRRALSNALASNQLLIETLAHTNNDLTRVLNAVPTIIIGLDYKGNISHWNSAAERTFCLEGNTVYGKTLFECGIHWLSERSTIDDVCKAEGVNERSDHPFELNGDKRWFGLTVRAVDRLGPDSHTIVLLSGADITDRRVQDEQFRQAQKLEAIGQLAAGIAHEINTPTQYVGDNVDFVRRSFGDIAVIVEKLHAGSSDVCRCGSAEALQSFRRDFCDRNLAFALSEIPSALDQAFDGTKRIGTIVKAMKEFSHPGSQQKTSLDLNHVIEITAVIARSEWKYVAQLDTKLAADLPQVMCYPGEINQVLLNLLVNASHAIQERTTTEITAPPGEIKITTRQIGGYVEVCVADNGIGIPTELQSRVFELFFTTKEVGKGTGQGLAFAHSVIVNKHGGQLWLESQYGQGTSFYVRLPLVSKAETASTLHPVGAERWT